MLQQQRANSTNVAPSETAQAKIEPQETPEEERRSSESQHYRLNVDPESQPRDLSPGGSMQIQLNMRTRENFAMAEDFSRPEDLSVNPPVHLQAIKTEDNS